MTLIAFSVVIDINIRLSCLGSDPILKSAFAVSEKCKFFKFFETLGFIALKGIIDNLGHTF